MLIPGQGIGNDEAGSSLSWQHVGITWANSNLCDAQVPV